MLPENLEAVLFSAGGGEVCGTSDQLHFPLTQKRQLGFDFISSRSACCFPSTNDSVFQIFLALGLLYTTINGGTSKVFSVAPANRFFVF